MLFKVWNAKLERWEWEDLAYTIGAKDEPDPLHGKPVKSEADDKEG